MSSKHRCVRILEFTENHLNFLLCRRDLSEQSVQIVDECGDSGILSDLFFCTHPHDEDLNPLFIYKEM